MSADQIATSNLDVMAQLKDLRDAARAVSETSWVHSDVIPGLYGFSVVIRDGFRGDIITAGAGRELSDAIARAVAALPTPDPEVHR